MVKQPILQKMNVDILTKVISYLDRTDLSNLAKTCSILKEMLTQLKPFLQKTLCQELNATFAYGSNLPPIHINISYIWTKIMLIAITDNRSKYLFFEKMLNNLKSTSLPKETGVTEKTIVNNLITLGSITSEMTFDWKKLNNDLTFRLLNYTRQSHSIKSELDNMTKIIHQTFQPNTTNTINKNYCLQFFNTLITESINTLSSQIQVEQRE